MNKLNKFFTSGTIPKVITILVIILVFLLIFQAGFVVGFRKAAFSFNWNKNYMMNGHDPRSIMAPFMYDRDGINPHGAVGEIISINLPSILVKRTSGTEEVINIGPKTDIRSMRQIASTSDLTLHKQVIVIGEANSNGQIDATLIRILQESSNYSTSTTPISPMRRLNK